MDSQTELFPFAHPATVLCYVRRLEIMVLKVAPELTRAHCWALLADLSLTFRAMDAIRIALPPVRPFTITVDTLLRQLRQLDGAMTESLRPNDCLALLGQLSATTAIMQGIGRAIERDRRWQHRQTLPKPSERETLRASETIALSHFERIGRRGRRAGSWS